jgi:hypothetical protein
VRHRYPPTPERAETSSPSCIPRTKLSRLLLSAAETVAYPAVTSLNNHGHPPAVSPLITDLFPSSAPVILSSSLSVASAHVLLTGPLPRLLWPALLLCIFLATSRGLAFVFKSVQMDMVMPSSRFSRTQKLPAAVRKCSCSRCCLLAALDAAARMIQLYIN